MSGDSHTGAFRYRIGGIFRRLLVLQLEFEGQRLVSALGWPPRYAPERYWRDATLEDLTAEPSAPVTAPKAGPCDYALDRDARHILTQIADGGDAKLNSAAAQYLLGRLAGNPEPARDE